MANRCLLHQKKLEAFKDWLIKEGWEIHSTKSCFEVLRAKKEKKWLIVYQQIGKTVHYTVRRNDVPIVRRFLKETKNGGKYGKQIREGN